MMRRLSYGLFCLLVAGGLLSCSKEEEKAWDGPVLKMNVWCRNTVETRTSVAGDESRNENFISRVDFFFYPGEQTSSAASYHFYQEPKVQGNASFLKEVTSDLVNTKIFPVSPVQYDNTLVFALVNAPESVLSMLGEYPSLDKILETTVTTDFRSQAVQDLFIMTGSTVISRRDEIVVADGTIELERLACKLTVGLKVKDYVDIVDASDPEKVARWQPMLKGMSVYLVDGVENASLGGEASTPSYVNYREYAKTFLDQDTEEPIDKQGDYYFTEPVYMYPQHWTYGSTESPEKEPYIKLVIPWHRLDYGGYTGIQKQFYYKILIPEDVRADYKKRFASNNWYHINVDVSMLGSDTDDAKVALQKGQLYIAYWQDKDVVIKHAVVGNARYLSVNRESYELNNLTTVEMGYTSSHPITIKDISVTRPYYGTDKVNTTPAAYGATIKENADGEKYLDYNETQRKKLNNNQDWLKDTGTSVVYTHTLNNDYTQSSFDYSPYTIRFTIAHLDRPDDTRYQRTITLTQYPGIYIEATHNPDAADNSHYGYVFVNGGQLTMSEFDALYPSTGYVHDNNWRLVHYHEGGKDMFKINVTVLPSGSSFVIGDPRSPDINNLGYDFEKGAAIEGGTRSLKWYHPTDNTPRTTNMLAPSYRLTSKFYTGIEKDGVPFKEAQYRCASIQENGFPAGRWRLPTWGEITFISNLSANKVFEVQFSNGGYYWAADGRAIRVNGSTIEEATEAQLNGRLRNTKEGKRPVCLMRCVYDAWYWGDKQVDNIATPVWGDAPLRGDPTE